MRRMDDYFACVFSNNVARQLDVGTIDGKIASSVQGDIPVNRISPRWAQSPSRTYVWQQ
jgi:hypothetical protein